MRHSLIIVICAFNACIAAGLLWYVFGSKPETSNALLQPTLEQLSEEELWQHAEGAKSSREAANYLGQLDDHEALKVQAAKRIEVMLAGDPPELDQWPFYLGLLQVLAAEAHEQDELSGLAMVVKDLGQPLTIRDTAFRNYIDSTIRIGLTPVATADALALIGMLHKENNSLSEVALLAESFLVKNGPITPERTALFEERLWSVLADIETPEDKRITALNILSERDRIGDSDLTDLYSEAGVRLKTSILKRLSSMEVSKQTRQWIKGVQPATPEQERMRLHILSQ